LSDAGAQHVRAMLWRAAIALAVNVACNSGGRPPIYSIAALKVAC